MTRRLLALLPPVGAASACSGRRAVRARTSADPDPGQVADRRPEPCTALTGPRAGTLQGGAAAAELATSGHGTGEGGGHVTVGREGGPADSMNRCAVMRAILRNSFMRPALAK